MRMALPGDRASAPGGLAAATAALASTVLVELEFHAVDQGLPARLDDVRRHADRPPVLVLVARFYEHADQACRPVGTAEDTDLVVVQPDLGHLGIELLHRLPERLVEGVDGAVPL